MRVILGSDPRERAAFEVADRSIRRRTSEPVFVHRLSLPDLIRKGWYTRPTERRDGRLWDVISEAPMSTEHAIARFFTPLLCGRQGWALFADSDVLCRADLSQLFHLADPASAVMVVKHEYVPTEAEKMDGQIQTRYARKNWSSVILWNCEHRAHAGLDWRLLNAVPGRDLHRFCWLRDEDIGELPVEWNFLVGVTPPRHHDPKLVHFTLGTPDMTGYEGSDYADEWREYLHAGEESFP